VIGRRAAARPAAKIRRVGVLRPASAEHVRAGRPSRGAGAQRGAPREIPVERPTQFSLLITRRPRPPSGWRSRPRGWPGPTRW